MLKVATFLLSDTDGPINIDHIADALRHESGAITLHVVRGGESSRRHLPKHQAKQFERLVKEGTINVPIINVLQHAH